MPRTSSLPAAAALDGTELVPIVQAGDSVQATATEIAATAFLALTNAVDDAAAAIAGVAVGGIYRNGSALQIRIS